MSGLVDNVIMETLKVNVLTSGESGGKMPPQVIGYGMFYLHGGRSAEVILLGSPHCSGWPLNGFRW